MQKGERIKSDKGTYIILKTIGKGKRGTVFLADFHPHKGTSYIRTSVALKILDVLVVEDTCPLFANKIRLIDFEKEIRNNIAFSHTHIPTLIDSFKHNGIPCLAMKYIDGCSLFDFVDRHGPLPETESIRIIEEVALIIEAMHSMHLLHLDISPNNILLCNDSAYIIDLGNSMQYLENGIASDETAIRQGQLEYTPLELINCNTNLFLPAMDIYSLCATMYYALTGATPPNSKSISEHGKLPVHELEHIGVSKTLIELLIEGMQADYQKRISNIGDFISSLRKI